MSILFSTLARHNIFISREILQILQVCRLGKACTFIEEKARKGIKFISNENTTLADLLYLMDYTEVLP